MRRSWTGWFAAKTFAPGDVIVREGDMSEVAYILQKGTCQAFHVTEGEKRVLRRMGPGEVFGEASVFLGGRRTASVEAIDTVTALVVTRWELDQELDRQFWLGAFVRALAGRFIDVDRKLTEASRIQARSDLTVRLLLHFNFAAQSVGPHRREAVWSTLAEKLGDELKLGDTALLEAIRHHGLFEVDPARDVIALQRVPTTAE